jgi:3D (Asp-Asp-Asp) domain-containing protein
MSHDATKVVLGATRSSFKHVENYAADPATFPAGTMVRLKSDGTISVTKADGAIIGVSLGRSLSDTKRLAVLKSGTAVPVLLTAAMTAPVPGGAVWSDDVTGKANIVDDGAVTTTVTNGVYVSGVLDGIAEDGTEVDVALIDMPGGL